MRYIDKVSNFENIEENSITVSFGDVWNIGKCIPKLDSRVWADKESLPDNEKRWELQSLFYLVQHSMVESTQANKI